MSYGLFAYNELSEPVSKVDLYEYLKKYKLGYSKIKKFVLHNIRLSIQETSKYDFTIFDKIELFSVGLIVLMKVVNIFDNLIKNCFSGDFV